MSNIMPKGEKVRKSVKWISEKRSEDRCKSLTEHIEAAALRFNLSPVEQEYLSKFFEKQGF